MSIGATPVADSPTQYSFQRSLAETTIYRHASGQHRTPWIPDLLIAAIAELA